MSKEQMLGLWGLWGGAMATHGQDEDG